MIRFVVPGIARPQGSIKSFYDPRSKRTISKADNPETGPWRTAVAWEARRAGCHVTEGAIEITVEVYLPRPMGHFGRRGLLPSAPALPTKKPDGDKLLRAILDALTGVAYRDDAQVTTLTLRKRFCSGDQPPEARIAVGPAGAEATASERAGPTPQAGLLFAPDAPDD